MRKQLTVHISFTKPILSINSTAVALLQKIEVSERPHATNTAQMYKPWNYILHVAKEGNDLHMLLTTLCYDLKKVV